MKRGIALLCTLLLAGCATKPVVEADQRFFNDALFAAAPADVRAADIFALSDDMRRALESEIARTAGKRGRQVALVEALYQGDLKLEYDSAQTRNAAQTYAARAGNCLSLVIMTAAFAKALDLPVTYQKVSVDDEWSRAGELYLAIGHVNLTLGRRKTDEGGFGHRVGKKPAESDSMTIDFLPPDDIRSLRTSAIGEDIIVAMYMNNRAVESLAQGRVDDAYWWAREAIVQSPAFVTSYNTLGVVYERHRNPREAERVLRYVLEREPGNTQAMSNLVAVLAQLGRTEESQRLAATLERIDPEPPFSHFRRAMTAIRAGDLPAAKSALALEIARAPDYHEFHFWMAVVQVGLGENDEARRHLTLAMRNSTNRRDHDLYAAKLDRLKQVH